VQIVIGFRSKAFAAERVARIKEVNDPGAPIAITSPFFRPTLRTYLLKEQQNLDL